MSVETDPLPPVPEHTPPIKEDETARSPGRMFNQTWTRWFVSLREKVNVLSESLVNLGNVAGNGLISKNGDSWIARAIQGVSGRTVVTDGNGISGNPTVDVVTGDLVAGSNISFSGSGAGRLIGSSSLIINSTGGGGSSAWTLINQWEFSSSGATLHVIGDVSSYNEILIACHDVTTASSAWRCLTVSTDNQTSWGTSVQLLTISGEVSGTYACGFFHSNAASAARSGSIQIPKMYPTIWGSSPTTNPAAFRIISLPANITHVRVSATTDFTTLSFVNLTGGSVFIWGR